MNYNTLESCGCITIVSSVNQFSIYCRFKKENPKKSIKKRDMDGRFIVSLPFREAVKDLGESRNIALRRFLTLERRLNANKQLKNNYSKFMDEYLRLGHMSRVS